MNALTRLHYLFTVSPVENIMADKVVRGVVHIEGKAESFIKRIYRTVVSVLVRESGF